MALNPKKLAAFVDKQSKSPFNKKMGKFKGGGDDEHDDGEEGGHGEDEHDDGDEHDDDHHEVDVDSIIEQVDSGKGDKQLMKLAKGADAEDEDAPGWVEDEDKWHEAKSKVEDQWDTLDQPVAVAAHIYKQMGGKVKGGGDHQHGGGGQQQGDGKQQHGEGRGGFGKH